jgi:hypothetical protein
MRRQHPWRIAATLVTVAALALTGCKTGGDDDDVTTGTGGNGEPTGSDGLPLIFQDAEDPDSIDWGDRCDTETGRVMIPVANAAPCVEPWDDSQDNGGATSQGVSADEILVVVYQGQPDPLQQALVEDAGANTDPDANANTAVDYLEMFANVYETYGRRVRVEIIRGSGGPADATAAAADAQKAIDLKPFAVVGGPTQTPVWWQELTAAGIVCLGFGCGLAETWDNTEAAAPYLWPTGHAPEQADEHLLELIGKQLAGKNAEFAGDEAMRAQPRVFGFVQAETETGEYKARNDEFARRLEEDYGETIAARSTYLFDPAAGQQIATTVISRMKDAGVTTIILSVDPLLPANITREATAQGYFPEWVLGPSVLADTTIFGRQFDQQQWSNMVGISLPTARASREATDSYRAYEWYYGSPPPVNTQAVLYPGAFRLLTGIHLAGPNLTPETFRRGMFRFVPQGSGITYSHESWGEELWGRADYNSTDDAGAIWWDAEATGEDETGNEGTGMLRYVLGGKRYLPGEWPEDPLPFFDAAQSVTVYDERPEEDAVPEYPPPPGSPAAGG